MAGIFTTITFKEELRPALLRRYEPHKSELNGRLAFRFSGEYERVLVHTLQRGDEGLLVIEHEDGQCSTAKPSDIRFLDSEDRFREVCWDVPEGEERDD